MKAEQRAIYLALTRLWKEHWTGLCGICRYAKWFGCCEDATMECHCGIESVEESAYNAWSGDDCWAFRPLYTRDDCVDATGLILNGEYPDMGRCVTLPRRRIKVKP